MKIILFHTVCTILFLSLSGMQDQSNDLPITTFENPQNAAEFSRLPNELYVYLTQFLDDPEIEKTSATCKFLRVFFLDPKKIIEITPTIIEGRTAEEYLAIAQHKYQTLARVKRLESNPVALILALLNLGTDHPSFNVFTKTLSEHVMGDRIFCFDAPYNNLQQLPPQLSALQHIQRLDLAGNQLNASAFDIICTLSNLKELNLGKNLIQVLPPTLQNLTKLEILELWHNPLQSDSLSNLGLVPTLLQLNLSFNAIPQLPANIQNLKKLQSFQLQMTGLPLNEIVKLSKMRSLSEINLGGNGLGTFPAEFKSLTQLSTLHLWGNLLAGDQIEKLCKGLPQLTKLGISDNELTNLPEDLFYLRHLRHFLLDRNQLTDTTWPKICTLASLHTLSATKNFFTAIPKSISQLTQLTSLDLSKNYLGKNLDSLTHLGTLPHLQKLKLSSNQLNSIFCLHGTQKLRELTLSSNFLSSDKINTICYIPSLTELNLSKNYIDSAPGILCLLPHLKKLNMKYNFLSQQEKDLIVATVPADTQVLFTEEFTL